MAGTKTILFITLFGLALARLGFLLIAIRSAEDFKDHFEFDDQRCGLAGKDIGMIGSEDMALGKHGILFITSGDLENTFGFGAAEANTGSIFLINIKADMPKGLRQLQLVKANIHSSPFTKKDFRFQPHGMDVSNVTDRLYVVNHNHGYSSVIVFDIMYNLKCINEMDCPLENSVSLLFISEIRSNLFPLMALNDVVEASPNEFYVTQWLPYAYPKRGKNRPDSIREYAEVISNNPYAVMFFNYRWTTVFHCTWGIDTESQCKIATTENFFMANGVTISPDRTTVFINDPLDFNIMALSRNTETGTLTKLYNIKLPSIVDNIEYDDEANEIILGSIIPGGIAVASKTKDKDRWTIKGVLKHDETKLKQISAAARIGSTNIILGSPFSEGILVCSK